MPFDQAHADSRPRPRLGPGEQGGPLSRQLAHIALLQLAYVIRRGSALLYGRVSRLSDFEWRVLTRVCDRPGLSINDLGEVLGRGVPQVSRTVKHLVALGLVRRVNLGGGPGVAISPTPAGEAAYAPMVAAAEQSERDLTQGLTEADLKILQRILDVMLDNAVLRLAREREAQSGDPDQRSP